MFPTELTDSNGLVPNTTRKTRERNDTIACRTPRKYIEDTNAEKKMVVGSTLNAKKCTLNGGKGIEELSMSKAVKTKGEAPNTKAAP
mmetsp:Transcript_103233/g.194256  ORF Transcript_103233/g.194256 Transcript_103233/m.194256 type:complete len:87 (-) Transcript_103233:701-961(-)